MLMVTEAVKEPISLWLLEVGRRRFYENLVLVAPDPSLARLERGDQRMPRGPEVPGGVLVSGGIAAADVPAEEALAKVHPGVAGFETFLAAVDPVAAGDGDRREVAAFGWHRQSPGRLEQPMVLDRKSSPPSSAVRY
jgi:hypothetical protein